METNRGPFKQRIPRQEGILHLALKRSVLAILGALWGLLGVLQAEDVTYQILAPFGTLNNTDSSLVIPPEKAQDLLNVEISPGGRSVKKREGFATAFALTYASSPVHGTHYFYDDSGDDIALVFHDSIMSASISGGAIANVFTESVYDVLLRAKKLPYMPV